MSSPESNDQFNTTPFPQTPGVEYISAVEAAEHFGLTNDHVASLCRKGKVEGVLVGRVRYVKRSSLENYLAQAAAEREGRNQALAEKLRREHELRTAASAAVVAPSIAAGPLPAVIALPPASIPLVAPVQTIIAAPILLPAATMSPVSVIVETPVEISVAVPVKTFDTPEPVEVVAPAPTVESIQPVEVAKPVVVHEQPVEPAPIVEPTPAPESVPSPFAPTPSPFFAVGMRPTFGMFVGLLVMAGATQYAVAHADPSTFSFLQYMPQELGKTTRQVEDLTFGTSVKVLGDSIHTMYDEQAVGYQQWGSAFNAASVAVASSLHSTTHSYAYARSSAANVWDAWISWLAAGYPQPASPAAIQNTQVATTAPVKKVAVATSTPLFPTATFRTTPVVAVNQKPPQSQSQPSQPTTQTPNRTVATAANYVTSQQLADQLAKFSDSLRALIYMQTGSGATFVAPQIAGNGNGVLYGGAPAPVTSINSAVVHLTLTASDIPPLSYFPATSTIAIGYGGTGTSTAPGLGQLLVGNSNGGYDFISTSSLAAGGSFIFNYPLVASGNSISLGFGTTTSNTWSGVQSFTTASTTNLVVSGLGGSAGQCLSVTSSGTVVASSCSALSNAEFVSTTFGATTANATSTLIGFNAGMYALASSTIGNGTQTGGLTISGGATTTGNLVVQGTGTSSFAGNISVSGNIVPTANNTYSLGSSVYQWKDIFVGPGSIYVNGQEVLHTDPAHDVNVTADVNQNLIIQTSGTGDVQLNPTGTGVVYLKGNVLFSGGKTFNTSDNSALQFTDGIIGGNIKAAGNILSVNNTNGSLEIDSNGLGAVYVNHGNFGIGTTSPLSALSVGGNGYISGNVSIGGNLTLPALSAPAGSLVAVDASGKLIATSSVNTSVFVPYTGATTNVDVGSHNINAQTVTVNGGTSAGTSLDVNGTINSYYYNVNNSQFIDNNKNLNVNSVSVNNGNGVIDSSGYATFAHVLGVGSSTIQGIFNSTFANNLASTTLAGSTLLGNATTTSFAISNLTNKLLSTNGSGSIVATTVSLPLTFSSNTLAINQATASTDGYLSSTDWNTFNNKLGTNWSTSVDAANNTLSRVSTLTFFNDATKLQNVTDTYNKQGLEIIDGITPANRAGLFPYYRDGGVSTFQTGDILVASSSGAYYAAPVSSLGINSLPYYASSTIGDGTQAGGLTISGGATTTANAYIAGRIGVGIQPNASYSIIASGSINAGGNLVGSAALLGSGSASAPGYSFSADSSFDTGIFRPAENTLGFTTGGIEAARFTSTGNLGIGTTSPYLKLSVGGDIIGTNLTATGTLSVAGLTNLIGGITSFASSTIGNGTQTGGLTISGGATTTGNSYVAGRVGIGTASPNIAFALDAVGTINVTGGYSVGTVTTIAKTGTSDIYLRSSAGKGIAFIPNAGVTTDLSTAAAYITSGGNLGVGTTSPFANLSIHANNSSTNTTLFAIGSSTANSTTTLLVVTNIGNLGVGTAGPSYKVDVVGDVNASLSYKLNGNPFASQVSGGIYTQVTSPTGVGRVLIGGSDPTTFYDNNTQIFRSAGGTEYARLTSTGFGIGTTSPFAQLSISNSVTTPANTNLFAIASTTGGTSTSTNLVFTALGRLGIGTSSPYAMLSVAGDIVGTNITATGTLSVSGLTNLAGGITSYASSTIGDGTQAGGLTISGGATTTGKLTVLGPFVTGSLPSSISPATGGIYLQRSSSPFVVLVSGSTQAGQFRANAINRIGFTDGGGGSEYLSVITSGTGISNVGVSTTSPFAQFAIHANNGSTNTTLFAIGSSTASATTTLFTVDNKGNVNANGLVTSFNQGFQGWNLIANNQLFIGGGLDTGVSRISAGVFGFGNGAAGNTSGSIIALASSTIGDGTQAGGLTISGGATTTGNAYFAGTILVPTAGTLQLGTSVATTSASALSLSSAVSSTGITLYNTADQSTNFSRGTIYSNNGYFTIRTEKGGTGADWPLLFQSSNGIGSIEVSTSGTDNSSGFVQINSGQNTPNRYGVTVGNGTYGAGSGVQIAVGIIPTIAQSGSASYSALTIQPTETSVGSGSSYLLKVGTSTAPTLFTVSNTGTAYFSSNVGIGTTTPQFPFVVQGSSNNALIYDNTALYVTPLAQANGGAGVVGIFPGATGGVRLNVVGFSAAGVASINTNSSSLKTLQLYNISSGGLQTVFAGGTGTNYVGIGTTSPFAQLSIHANATDTNTTLFAIGSSTSNSTTTLFNFSNAGVLTTSNGSNSLTVTPTTISTDAATLNINPTGAVQLGPTLIARNGSSVGGSVQILINSSLANSMVLNVGSVGIQSQSSGMMIGENIGSAISQTGTAGYTALKIAPVENTFGSALSYLIDAQATTSTTGLAGGTTNPDKFVVTNTGKVAVGTTTPFALFGIHANNGDTNTTLFAIGSSTANSTTTLFSVSNSGDTNINVANLFQVNQGNGTRIMQISNQGMTFNTTGTFGQNAWGSNAMLEVYNNASVPSRGLLYVKGVAGQTGNYFTANNTSNTTEVSLSPGGNEYLANSLGLGTTSPYAQLSIVATSTSGLGAPTTLFTIASTTGGNSTSTLFTVTNSGKVGIGTSNPNVVLVVAGSTGGTADFQASSGEVRYELNPNGQIARFGNSVLAWQNSTNAVGTTDTGLSRFAAGILAIGNGTSGNTAGGIIAAASSTIGDGTQIGGLTISGGATTTGTFAIGTNPAVGGVLRIPNNATISGRNAANTGDVVVASVDTSNWVRLGNAGLLVNASNVLAGFTSDQGGGNRLQISGNAYVSGSLGLGTTTPFSKFAIHANNGDTNTTLFAIGSSTASATTTLFNVTNAGNVGIGSSSPSALLSVDANALGLAAGVSPVIIKSQSGLTADMFDILNNAGTLRVRVNSFGNLTGYGGIQSSGSVGTAPVNGAFLSSGNGATTNGFVFQGAASQTGDPLRILDSNNNFLDVINANGNLGVGTSTPFADLAIHAVNGSTNTTLFAIGSSTASATTTLFTIANNGAITVEAPGGQNWMTFTRAGTQRGFVNSANNLFGIYSAANDFLLGTNNNEVVRITTTNNVGIGTTSPYLKLSVGGDIIGTNITATGTLSVSGLTNLSGGIISFASSTIGNGTQAGGLTISGGATTTGSAYIGGSLGIGVQAPVVSLDVKGGSGDASGLGILRFNTNGGTNDVGLKIGALAGSGSNGYVFVQGIHTGVANDANIVLNATAGNVGVGTTSPFSKFAIHANNGSTNTTLFAIGSSTATATTTLFSVDNVGNTAVAGILSVTGASTLSGTVSLNGRLFLNTSGLANTSNANGFNLALGTADSSSLPVFVPDRASASTGFAAGATGNLNAIVGGSEITRWTSTGFGIGNTAPAYALDVTGFVNTNAASGYKQNGETTLFASSTNISLAVGASSAAAWMTASSTTWYDIAIGSGALSSTPLSAQAQNNTAIGALTLSSITTGSGNTAIGSSALHNDTSGVDNFALGASTLYNNSTGSYNVGIGAGSLVANTTGTSNVSIGRLALQFNTVGGNNVALGAVALNVATSSNNNTAIGFAAGAAISGATGAVGNGNTLLGYQAGSEITTGSNNTVLGYFSGSGASVTTGTNNILVGYDVNSGLSRTGNNQLNIGNLIFGTGLGSGSTLSSGNVGIGTSSPFTTFAVSGNGFFTNNVTATNVYATSTLGVGTTSPAATLAVSGNGYFTNAIGVGELRSLPGITTSNLTIRGQSSCAGNNALQTDGVGNVVCGSVGGSGVTSNGIWNSNNVNGNITEATTTYQVGIGATSTPYAMLSVRSGSTATTTLVLQANPTQTAHILDLYTADTNLADVIDANGNLGLGSTNPWAKLVVNGGLAVTASSTIGDGTQIGGLTVSGGATTTGNAYIGGALGVGTMSPNYTLDVVGTINSSNKITASESSGTTNGGFTFTQDGAQDTGMFSPSDGTLDFYNNGNHSININSSGQSTFYQNSYFPGSGIWNTSGNVGIGTTNPQNKLDVNGGVAVGSYAGNNTAPSNGLIVSGSVGVGTTSPFAALSVNGSGFFGGNLTASNITATGTLSITGLTNLAGGITSFASSTIGDGTQTGGLTINGGATTTGNAYFAGNVGIGTQPVAGTGLSMTGTANVGQLNVNGTPKVVGTGFYGGSASNSSINLISTNGAGTSDSVVFKLGSNGSIEGGRFQNSSGIVNFGIGTTSPLAKLSVHAGATDTNTLLFAVASSTANSTTTLFSVSNIGDTTVNGKMLVQGSGIWAAALSNSVSGNNAQVAVNTTGTVISRNVVDTNTALTVSQLNSGSTGDILDLKNSSVTVGVVTQSGSFGIGTTTPWGQLSVNPNGITGPAFVIGSSTLTSFIVASSGNVGLGTVSPSNLATTPLTLNSSSSSGTFTRFDNQGATKAYFGYYGLGSTGMAFLDSTGSTPNFLVTNGGSVGIGTSSPYLKLSVAGDIIGTNITATGTLSVAGLTNLVGGITSYASSTIGNGTQTGGLTISGGATTTGNAYFNGNVGIGTNAPSSILQISSASPVVKITATSAANAGLSIAAGGVSGAYLQLGNAYEYQTGGAASKILFGGAAPTTVVPGNIPFAIDTSGGVVGVGTSSPFSKFAIHANSGETNTTLFAIGSSTASATTTLFSVSNTGAVTTGNTLTVNGNISGLTSTQIIFGVNARIITQGVGNIDLTATGSGTGFNLLQFGGITNAFPAIGRNSTSLYTGLADGSLGSSFGIGTTSPDGKLSVHANAGETYTNNILFDIASSTSNSTTTLFVITNTGNVGIGTAAPTAPLQVVGTISTNGQVNALSFRDTAGNIMLTPEVSNGNTQINAALAAGVITFRNGSGELGRFNGVGSFGIGTTSPYALLSVGGGNSYPSAQVLFAVASSTNTATTTYLTLDKTGYLAVGAGAGGTDAYGHTVGNSAIFSIDASSSTTTISNLSVGNLVFDTDAGMVQLSDIPVSANPGAGTIESQSLSIGGTPTLTVYGENDGSGGVQNLRVSVGTTTPYSRLSVWGAGTGTGQLFELTNNASTTVARFLDNGTGYFAGNIGIGTTSPFAPLSVQGNGYFAGTVTATNVIATGTLAVSGLSTLTNVIATASSTIGDGTQTGGLTISGGATTTGNAYFAGTLGVGVQNPAVGSIRASGGISAATSIGITGSSVFTAVTNGSVMLSNSAQNNFGLLQFGGTTSSFPALGRSGTNLYVSSADGSFGANLGVGTTSPFAKFAVHANNGDTNTTLFAIGSSTASATSTLFNVSNTGNTTIGGTLIVSGTNTSSFAGPVAGPTGGSWKLVNTNPTATTPVFAPVGADVTTGLGGLSGTLSLITGGTSRLFVDSTGNIGIGTTSPWGLLSINPNGITGPAFAVGSSTATNFVITSAGDIGVGTSSPIGNFDISVTGGVSKGFVIRDVTSRNSWFDVGVASAGQVRFNQAGGVTLAAGASSIGRFNIGALSASSNVLSLQGVSGQTANLFMVDANSSGSTNNGSQFIINNLGYVGIATTSPYALLSVGGGNTYPGAQVLFAVASSTNTATTTYLTLDKNGYLAVGAGAGGTDAYGHTVGNSAIFSVDASSSTTTISNLSVGNLTFDVDAGVVNLSDIPLDSNAALGTMESQSIAIGGTPVFTVYGESNGAGAMQNGRIGIGTTTPYYVLDVASTTGAGAVARFTNATGNCTINPTNSALSCSSDERLKHNINSLGSTTLEAIMLLNPVTYNWNTEATSTTNTHTGFLAQAVQMIFPDLVSSDSNGYLTLNYAGFVPYIVSAIQELYHTVQGFADEFTTKKLCVADDSGAKTCITKAQLDAMLQATGQTAAAGNSSGGSSGGGSSGSTSTSSSSTTSSSDTSASSTSPDTSTTTPDTSTSTSTPSTTTTDTSTATSTSTTP